MSSVRSLVWRSLDEPGLEYFTLRELSKGRQLEGIVIRLLKGAPLQASYKIACDTEWKTRFVDISVKSQDRRRGLQLTVDSHQRWWNGEKELTSLRGCHDVDLTITPSTNTLAIRRLKLRMGESEEVAAAWVRFPTLSVQLLPQRYTHLADGKYRYESRKGAFSVEFEVDTLGFVGDYPGFWKLEGSS